MPKKNKKQKFLTMLTLVSEIVNNCISVVNEATVGRQDITQKAKLRQASLKSRVRASWERPAEWYIQTSVHSPDEMPAAAQG